MNQGNLDFNLNSQLEITKGASFVNGDAIISTDQNASSTILVDGGNSSWLNESLTLGDEGDATLSITNGGFLRSFDTVAGKQNGGSGSILVKDAGSHLQSTGDISIGTGGAASLTIQDGGFVQSINASIAAGSSTTQSAIVSLTGANSRLESFGDLAVGGGKLTAGYSGKLEVGAGSTVAVGGASKVWTAGEVKISGGTYDSVTRFENMGQVILDSGAINNLTSAYVQSAGSTKLNGGTLSTGSLTNTGGDLTIQGGRLDVSSYKLADFDAVTAISGSMAGQLTVQSGDDLNASGFMSTAVSNSFDAGDVTIANAGSLFGNSRLVGSLDNQTTGDVRVASGEKMQFATNNAIHSNRGVIEVIGNTSQFAEVEFNGGLTNQTSGLIAARNATLRFDDGLTNHGSLGVSFGSTDVVGDVLNLGGISIGGGAETTFFGDVTQNGNVTVAKTGSRTSSAVIFGEFSGGGFVGGGDVFALGDLRPGYSPASVLMDGNLYLGGSTNTLIEIGGTSIGEFDQMLVSGDFSMDGQLDVQMWNNYQLVAGDEFVIADIGGLQSGAFAGLSEGDLVGTFGNAGLFITYNGGDGNDVSLFTAVPEPGTIWAMTALVFIISIRRKRRPGA